jgi:hypothetical protein
LYAERENGGYGFRARSLHSRPGMTADIYLSSQTSSNRKLLYWLLLCGLKFLT